MGCPAKCDTTVIPIPTPTQSFCKIKKGSVDGGTNNYLYEYDTNNRLIRANTNLYFYYKTTGELTGAKGDIATGNDIGIDYFYEYSGGKILSASKNDAGGARLGYVRYQYNNGLCSSATHYDRDSIVQKSIEYQYSGSMPNPTKEIFKDANNQITGWKLYFYDANYNITSRLSYNAAGVKLSEHIIIYNEKQGYLNYGVASSLPFQKITMLGADNLPNTGKNEIKNQNYREFKVGGVDFARTYEYDYDNSGKPIKIRNTSNTSFTTCEYSCK
jgi:hypothetical protein